MRGRCVLYRFVSTSVDKSEILRFERDMGRWWDLNGPARALHQMNGSRVEFIRDFVLSQRPESCSSHVPLDGLSIVDVGCGGGILSEALCRLGATVTGLDASKAAIRAASRHADKTLFSPNVRGRLRYVQGTVEEMVSAGHVFDVAVCSEVVEHVADPEIFLGHLARLGSMGIVVSTLNRTAASYAAAIVLGEYVLRLVPPGTHSWDKFLTPEELTATLQKSQMHLDRIKGLRYNPLCPPYWTFSSNTSVNYIAAFTANKQ